MTSSNLDSYDNEWNMYEIQNILGKSIMKI